MRTSKQVLIAVVLVSALAAGTAAHAQDTYVDEDGNLVTGGDIVEPSLAPQSNPGEPLAVEGQPVTQQGPQGSGGYVGARGLLNSLNDLDRPLSPEEITAYGAALQQQFPLTPELIRDYRRRLNASQRAAAAPPTGERPTILTDTIRVSLGTQGNTPQVFTSPGTVSIVSFFDRTGAPWPVASFVIGREDAFQVYAMQEGSNQLAIAPRVAHGYSNVAVSLVEEDQPIVIDLETNEERTHYRLDMSVNGLGPEAAIPVVRTSEPKMEASDELLMAFVQGTVPRNAQPLGTDDADVAAWAYEGDLYIRTNQTLISPSWSATLAGPGGIRAYRLRPAPVALITRNGQVTKVRITQ